MKKLILFVFAVLIFSSLASAILINEFTVDPQTDWNNSSSVSSTDEWIEIYNDGAEEINLSGWKLVLNDSSAAVEELDGIILSGEYIVLLNPTGSQNNDGQLILLDSNGSEVDKVSYGDWDDGNILDNAPDGNANSVNNECLARTPNGKDSGNDKEDFTQTKCSYGFSNGMQGEIKIETLPQNPSCVLDNDDVTIYANVSSSICVGEVVFGVLINETWGNYSTSKIGNIYSFKLEEELFEGGEVVEWKVYADDCFGNIIESDSEDFEVKYSTKLNIIPPTEDGLNGWYISVPTFELINPSANEIKYQWDSLGVQTYSSIFGLENASNDANVTGGIQVLKYYSDVCDEEVKEISLSFDFADPEIKDISPTENEIITSKKPTIYAFLDEKYQGNSGIDLESVKMWIDGNETNATVSASGSLDGTISYNLTEDLSLGEHEIIVRVYDKAGRTAEKSWKFTVEEEKELVLEILSPLEEKYQDKKVRFNLTVSEMATIEYINWDDRTPKWRTLCKNCDRDDRTKSVNEGMNHITFKATKDGVETEENVSFMVDSRQPRIIKNWPRSGFADGQFLIEFDEDHPVNLSLIYGNESDIKTVEANLTECEQSRRTKCSVEVELNEYDGQTISYYWEIEDVVGNKDESRVSNLIVDKTAPIIEDVQIEVNRRRVEFNVKIIEDNFERLTYIENGTEKMLCSRIKEGECSKIKIFSEGNHSVSLVAYDKAGNAYAENVEFSV